MTFSRFSHAGRTCLLVLLCPILAAYPDTPYTPDHQRALKIQRLNQNLKLLQDATAKREGGCVIESEMPDTLNEIDVFTFAKMQADGVPINDLCDDATFIRRTSLVLTGRLPDPERTRAFLADDSAGKRERYVDELLASDAFITHWSFYFQEHFESNGRSLLGGLIPYNEFFADAVATNKPLDEMATDMITSTGNTLTEGVTNFFVRSGNMARLTQDLQDNLAIAATTKFMGIPVECISCHDGAYHLENVNVYLAERKREELWQMAAYFSGLRFQRNVNRETNMIESFDITEGRSEGYLAESDSGDRPIRDGGVITPKFLTTGAEPQPGTLFRTDFATQVVQDRQFARHWANRLWGHAFGLAPVEPMDAFDMARLDPNAELPEGWEVQALDLDLLEHLTDKMIELDFDLRAYLSYLLHSATYQMSSTFEVGTWEDAYAPYYTRYLAHHMTSEQVYDSLVTATGVITQIQMRDRGTNNVLRLSYAHELPDTSQPRNDAYADLIVFLAAFGRGNRLDQPRTNAGSISQAMLMMNSPLIDERLLHPQSRLMGYLEQGMSAEQIITNLFLDILCREPSETEVAELLAELATYDTPQDQAATAAWLLLNRASFTFIH
ncbi:DUF1549 domain-containing protein [Sulfidibacter corallicola]|uniref:DUF1549 domain-containing protein n=1 Tax=Sulfidibacter corallicola TaxID=2818388 RepID=A0A8A4TZA1_SULCO|nr:DUF1549 domain-containing protein [Sulfidibacter corallicola]QTD54272.1 DUF1549 domain-containing protein [Sulfidibacter corallicola]